MTSLERFGIYKGEGRYHEETIYTMALIYSLINTEINNYLKKFDLSVGKLNILIAVKHHGKDIGMPQVEISKHLIVTPSNMTKLIDKLEQQGLVTRSALEGDRRVNIINITKEGIDLVDMVWIGYNAILKEAINKIEVDKQKQISDLMIEWFEKMV